MSTYLDDFKKMKDYLICVDSDGCAMDTMDIKHIQCFGPCMVEEWELSEWKAPILERWNVINLYSMTRGINRFKGLAMALQEINDTYCKIEDVDVLAKWVEGSDELSNPALEREITNNESIILKKALSWSQKVNVSINALSDDEKLPFEGVKEALAYAHQFCDIAIVSSANRQAVEDEWALYHLVEHVDIILAQDVGSKAFCIQELLKKGYDKANVLMVGDAPGDMDAADKSDVSYYPILVKYEKESWAEFENIVIGRLIAGSYTGEYEQVKRNQFFENLQ
ncbi:MAG: HAD hydrolase-like protein [Lachnospiraceae bacterium]|nr:HAD hydrolase-like protein [Lachnospiraceae bacterium]